MSQVRNVNTPAGNTATLFSPEELDTIHQFQQFAVFYAQNTKVLTSTLIPQYEEEGPDDGSRKTFLSKFSQDFGILVTQMDKLIELATALSEIYKQKEGVVSEELNGKEAS